MIIDKTKEKATWGRTCFFGDISPCKKYIHVHGHWTPTPQNGDIIITEMESGRVAEIELFDVCSFWNVPDQYIGKGKLKRYLDEPIGNSE
jgi:hypothetical protein